MILHMTLKRKWFDLILHGKKINEYRENKPYWLKKINKNKYDIIRFRNGYRKNSPTLDIELIKYTIYSKIIIFKLGKILNKYYCF